jgi:hypothetical protein
MREIAEAGAFYTVDHGELGLELLSVSTNDNMLKFFGEDHVGGFVFGDMNLQGRELNDFYTALLCSAEASADMWQGHISKYPDAVFTAERLGYYNSRRGYMCITPQDFNYLMDYELDALMLPGWDSQLSEQHEAEIAITAQGCKKLWDAIEYVVIAGEEFEPRAGFEHLRQYEFSFE